MHGGPSFPFSFDIDFSSLLPKGIEKPLPTPAKSKNSRRLKKSKFNVDTFSWKSQKPAQVKAEVKKAASDPPLSFTDAEYERAIVTDNKASVQSLLEQQKTELKKQIQRRFFEHDALANAEDLLKHAKTNDQEEAVKANIAELNSLRKLSGQSLRDNKNLIYQLQRLATDGDNVDHTEVRKIEELQNTYVQKSDLVRGERKSKKHLSPLFQQLNYPIQ